MREEINKVRINGDSNTFAKNEDPRIDSPEIQVVYPSITSDLPRYRPMDLDAPTPTPDPPVDPPKEKEEKHECKVNWTDAIKQNGTLFLLIALALLGLGVLIGQRNVAR